MPQGDGKLGIYVCVQEQLNTLIEFYFPSFFFFWSEDKINTE